MAKKRLLIVGDSFAQPTRSSHLTWYRYLDRTYDVINLAQAGVGQYKIHQQLLSASISTYDFVLILATSPYRLHVARNPFYPLSHTTHGHCDLIYEDVKSRLPDEIADKIVWWFHDIVDLDYQKFLHGLILKESSQHCVDSDKPYLIASYFQSDHLACDLLKLNDIWTNHPGPINHLNLDGHRLSAEIIQEQIHQRGLDK